MYSSSKFTYIRIVSLFACLLSLAWPASPRSNPRRVRDFLWLQPDSTARDTSKKNLPYPIRDKKPYETDGKRHPLDLSDPQNIKNQYSLDPDNYSYNRTSTIGGLDYKLPSTNSVLNQIKEDGKRVNSDYFRQRSQANNFTKGTGIVPPISINNKIVDRIFGSGVIDIRPRGTAEVIFAGNFNRVQNPAFSLRQQRTGQFDFRQKIQLNVTGQVGDKLKVNMNYDTEATFEFENQMKLDFAGKEDDIIKKIELGNVGLPLNSTLIQGSQSLFGVKATMQFGKLTVTSVVSQQRGKTQETELSGGTTTTRFDNV